MKAFCLKAPYETEIQERQMPEPRKGQALVKILTVAICGSDIHAYRGRQAIFEYPRVIGHEICGIVEGLGSPDDSLKVGDKVVVIPYDNCGQCIACRKGKIGCCENLKVMGVHVDGGAAEYCVVSSKYLVKVNQAMDPANACLIEPLAISAHAVHNARVTAGECVLVQGIGPIGIGAAEVAKTYGAKVIVADISEKRRMFAKDIFGYEHVLNPMDEGYQQQLAELTHGDMPDTIIDATGNGESMSGVFTSLSAGGKVVYVGISSQKLIIDHVEFHKRQTKLYGSRAATRFDFEYVRKCIEEGKIQPHKFVTDTMKLDEAAVSSFKALMEKKDGMFKGIIEVTI